MLRLYITLALVAFAGALLLGWLLRKHSPKRLIGASLCLATSACFFLLYALESEHRFYNLVVGLTTYGISTVALIRAKARRST
jgi:MFS-type transporter involved in bile tolerance (Atg22 family)